MSIACVDCRERIGHSRGVCSSCMNRQRKAIKRGLTTDKQLVASGKRLLAQKAMVGLVKGFKSSKFWE